MLIFPKEQKLENNKEMNNKCVNFIIVKEQNCNNVNPKNTVYKKKKKNVNENRINFVYIYTARMN